MSNRWILSEEKKKQVAGIITSFIDKLAEFQVTETSVSRYDVTIDLSDINGVGPYHVKEILETFFGYKEDDFSDNGWQMDYWYHFTHEESEKYPPLCLSGTAIIHEIILRGEEEDYKIYAEREALLKEDKEYQKLIQQGMDIIREAEELLKEN